MKKILRITIVMVAALLLGGLASTWFGASPAAVTPVRQADLPWSDGWALEDDLLTANANTTWQNAAPWGAAPVAVVEAAPPPSPPSPVGVARDGRQYTAIFQINGNGVVRLAAGDRLPDGGGNVLQVTGRRIVWLDAQGNRQQREIFNNFLGEP